MLHFGNRFKQSIFFGFRDPLAAYIVIVLRSMILEIRNIITSKGRIVCSTGRIIKPSGANLVLTCVAAIKLLSLFQAIIESNDSTRTIFATCLGSTHPLSMLLSILEVKVVIYGCG